MRTKYFITKPRVTGNSSARGMTLVDYFVITMAANLTVDFGEVKTVPTESKEKCFQMTSSAYLL